MTTEHLVYALAALQALDVLSTLYAFRNGATEANPVMRKLMGMLGTVPGLLLPKVVYGGLLWHFKDALTVEAAAIVAAVYGVVIFSNIRIGKTR